MKKQEFISWIAIVLALASCVLALLNGKVCFNQINNVIAALGILVSVLLGWQIYNVIRLRDIHEVQKEMKNHIDSTSVEVLRVEADTLLIHIGVMADIMNWGAVIRLATLIFKPLDRLDDVEQYYKSITEHLRNVYVGNEVPEELTKDLLKSMEENLENSEYVRDLYVWIKSR